MSEISIFMTFLLETINEVVGLTLTTLFIGLIIVIIFIELTKKFNPNIETTKQAIEYIIKTEKNNPESFDTEGLDELVKTVRETKIDLMFIPILGLMVLMLIRPSFTDLALKLYIPYVPSITFFVVLYITGLYTIKTVSFFASKTFELAGIIAEKIKEETLDE